MGDPIRIDFGTQSNPGRYGPEAGAVHINAYVEQIVEGQPPFPIYSTPGLPLFSDPNVVGGCRGMIVVGAYLYAILGMGVIKIDSGGGAVQLGSILGDTARFVSLARNAKAHTPQIALVSDGIAYYIQNQALTPLGDADLPAPNSVTFADQRLIFGIPDGRIFWTDIDDVTSIDALSFATAEGAPDGLVRVFAHRLDIWIFGKETIEIWRSTANADSPFQRVSGAFIPVGCAAPFSIASLNSLMFWIGDDCVPYTTEGYSPQALYHPPVSRDIEATADKDRIAGCTYSIGGAGFYEISGPDFTWTLNVSTNKWFQRQSYNSTRSKSQFAISFNNQTIVGDVSDSKLYVMDQTSFAEGADPLVWTLRTPPMHAYPNRISVDRFYADLIFGVGLNSTDGDESNPLVGLRWSDDGGQSFSRQIFKPLGADGQHQTRVVWNNLGSTGRQGRIWELQVSAPVVRGLRYAAVEGDRIGT